MQLRLYFQTPEPLTLPLSYHSILQGFIYDKLSSEPEYSSFLHDIGYIEDKKPFKLFVYSLLESEEKEISPPYITFRNSFSFEIRSPMNAFCDIFYLALMHSDKYRIGSKEVLLQGCVATKRVIDESDITVRTLSPICLNRTCIENNSKKTVYLKPSDDDFADSINTNFHNKYKAAFGIAPSGDICIEPVKFTEKNKYVTKFGKNIIVVAYNGKYRLSGDPANLTFLYDSGIGAKNSQGFGMFELT